MTVVERVLDQCRRAGVEVAVADDGDHLFLTPMERLTEDLVETIREHKTTLLVWLKMEPERWIVVEHDDGHVELIRGGDTGDGDRNSPKPEENGNCVTVATSEASNFDDLPLLQFCPRCGGWQWWQSVAGTWRCQTCDPPSGRAEQFAKRAAAIRAKYRC